MKKISFFSLIAICSICMLLVVHAATKDVKAPTMKTFKVVQTKATYEVGEKVYLNIDATDDISGIQKAYVFIGKQENDGFSGLGIDVYDLDGKPYFIVPADYVNNHVELREIDFIDNAGNQSNYNFSKQEADEFGMNYYNYNYSFDIVSGNSDVKGPVLKNITFDKNKLKYGESININVDATDDKSGVWGATLGFVLEGTDKRFYKTIEIDDNGKLIGSYKVPSYNGTYKLSGISLYDHNSNYTSYGADDYGQKYDNPLNINYSFTVDDAPNVDENIKISKIDYSYRKLVTPNIYKIGVKLNIDTDLVDYISVLAGKKDSNYKGLVANLYKEKEGYYSGYIDIDQYAESGIYILKELELHSENNSNILNKINEKLTYDNVELFEVIEEQIYDVITSTTDKELINKIKTAKEDAKIAINSSNSSILKKDVFKAIKGTNKTIYVESNGVQWVFNGLDIGKCKDINVKVDLNYIYDDELNDELNDIINKGLVINFADNGKLPGKALIRIKTDYALRDYLGIQNLYAYYYNGSQNDEKLDAVAGSINMTEDGYLEFYINHNSSFVLTNEVVLEKYVSDVKDDLMLNDKNVEKKVIAEKNIKEANNITLFMVVGISLVIIIVAIIIIVDIKKKKVKNKA